MADDDPIAFATALASFITFLPVALASAQDLTKFGLRSPMVGSGDQRSGPPLAARRSVPSPDLQRFEGHSERECEISSKAFPFSEHLGQTCSPFGQRPPGPACGHLEGPFHVKQRLSLPWRNGNPSM